MHPGLSVSDASLQNTKQLHYVSPKRPQIKYDFNDKLQIELVYVCSSNVYETRIQRCTWFVSKVSVLIFLCTNWQRRTSLMHIGA